MTYILQEHMILSSTLTHGRSSLTEG